MSSQQHTKMSLTQLTLLTMLNMMGSGIIMLPAKLAEVGTLSIVSWLVTAGGSTAMAYAFAKCGMLSKNGGGMGGYAQYASNTCRGGGGCFPDLRRWWVRSIVSMPSTRPAFRL